MFIICSHISFFFFFFFFFFYVSVFFFFLSNVSVSSCLVYLFVLFLCVAFFSFLFFSDSISFSIPGLEKTKKQKACQGSRQKKNHKSRFCFVSLIFFFFLFKCVLVHVAQSPLFFVCFYRFPLLLCSFRVYVECFGVKFFFSVAYGVFLAHSRLRLPLDLFPLELTDSTQTLLAPFHPLHLLPLSLFTLNSLPNLPPSF